MTSLHFPKVAAYKTWFLIIILLVAGQVLANKNCHHQFTSIADVQGSGAISPLLNQEVWVKGVVTADFRSEHQLGGFFIQSTKPQKNGSSGLYINNREDGKNIKVGDLVLLKGSVSEQFEVTQISDLTEIEVCQSAVDLPQATQLKLPVSKSQLEAVEGMRVSLDASHVITDIYNYLRYGEVTVSSQLLLSPTSLHLPGKAAQQYRKSIRDNQLIIDDGRLDKYPQPFVSGKNSHQQIDANSAIQLGQTISVTGVMHFAFGKFKLQPTEAIEFGQTLANTQPKPSRPAGQYRVASFNLENFFTTLDQNEAPCGPLKDFGCRGADSAQEYERQLLKLVTVINRADASIMGLQELENNDKQSIHALVVALNQAVGKEKWAYIDTGTLGEDVIKVGLIYQLEQFQPKGPFALLNAASDPEFLEDKNRIVVAQTFTNQAGHDVNVATVHFKSKSCRDAVDAELDQNDGQGCFNPTRKQVASQLAKWLATDPTGQGAQATFVVGDFNTYPFEDPLRLLQAKGYENMALKHIGTMNWTASYRGMVGSLDHVLANQAAQKLVTDVSQWHINSIAIREFGYNLEPLDEGLKKPAGFYRPDPYASSDHDLVMAGFEW